MDEIQNNSNWIVLNGNLYSELSHDFFLKNRAFRLGDGFFETMRIVNGKIHMWEAHYSRIALCCKALHIDLPQVFSSKFISTAIYKLLEKKEIYSGGRIRMTCFREGEGTYRPITNRLGFIIEAEPMPQRSFVVKDKGLTVDVYKGLTKRKGPLAAFKTLGNHVYIQAAAWALEQNLDDALILNESGHIIEGTSSNLFVVKNGQLHTPSVDDGCVGGVFRMSVINTALAHGIHVFESQLDQSDLLFADEVFFTNAVKGISWVGSFRSKRYYHKLSDRLLELINHSSPVIS